jgi:beta-phosphoglucomutase-like phosphatase (HAD superfamily)
MELRHGRPLDSGFEAVREARLHEAARSKPAPDLFLHAAAVVGAQVVRCLVVEDSPTGVVAGLAAGTTGWAAAGTYDADDLAGAHRVFESMPVRALRVAVTESAREADGMRLHGSGATRPTV